LQLHLHDFNNSTFQIQSSKISPYHEIQLELFTEKKNRFTFLLLIFDMYILIALFFRKNAQ